MPRKIEYKRVRDGLLYADVGKVRLGMLDQMVGQDHSDRTKMVRWMIEEEWKRRGLPALVEVIGEQVEGAEQVPVWKYVQTGESPKEK